MTDEITQESLDEAAELLKARPVEMQAHAPVIWAIDKQAVGLAVARRLDELKKEIELYKSAIFKEKWGWRG